MKTMTKQQILSLLTGREKELIDKLGTCRDKEVWFLRKHLETTIEMIRIYKGFDDDAIYYMD